MAANAGFSIDGLDDIFILDHISARLTDMGMVSVYLGVKNDDFNAIKLRYTQPCETNFQTLWQWYRNDADERNRKFNKLKEVLREVGRLDIVQKQISKNEYNSSGLGINDPAKLLTEYDVRYVASFIGPVYTRLARFVGVEQHKLDQIFVDNERNVQEQAYQALLLCVQGRRHGSRRDLCDGLIYIQRKDIILKMKQEWQKRDARNTEV